MIALLEVSRQLLADVLRFAIVAPRPTRIVVAEVSVAGNSCAREGFAGDSMLRETHEKPATAGFVASNAEERANCFARVRSCKRWNLHRSVPSS